MAALARHWRPIVALAALGAFAAMLLHAWPFLAYPVTSYSIDTRAPVIRADDATAVAGLAEVDITAAIGLPKFGYSSFAASADGFRTRLKARAFYLKSPGATPLALVQLDLGAGSLLLQRQVAHRIAAQTDVPAHALSLLVTHTHTGPSGYLDSDFYNVFGSNSPGFDPLLFEFLVEQISSAVIQAFEQRRPAHFAIGQTDIWGATRNRSLPAWGRNHGLAEDDLTDDMVFRAVNPTLTLLRIDQQAEDGCFYPAGALTSFSVHGTAIPAFTAPYHADVWAWLSRELAQQPHVGAAEGCKTSSPFKFVHGTFEATHADNNPNVQAGQRGEIEARRIGKLIGAAAISLHATLGDALNGELATAAASRELDLIGAGAADFGLCERAIIGAATAGAANDDEVFPVSYLPFLKEGWPRSTFTDGCHGVKQWMLSKLQLLMPEDRYPHRALLQVLRINDWVLATAPWEITLESGNRIREAVRGTLPPGDWRVEVASLANGFMGYATTPEEYSAQYYEGGHTIYGPGTAPFLAEQLARLSADLQASGAVADLPETSHFDLVTRQHWPSTPSAVSARKLIQRPVFVPAAENREPYWAIRYEGLPPSTIALHEPLLRVEQQFNNTWVTARGIDGERADDEGTDLAILLLENRGESAIYEVRWYNPAYAPAPAFRFHILPRGDVAALLSDTF